ncbi:MAG: DUF3592 domain-containing protein [Phycisphaerales bacterium]|nr:DUF3592 domain-containing protein [Phycisphaerales bacterium]
MSESSPSTNPAPAAPASSTCGQVRRPIRIVLLLLMIGIVLAVDVFMGRDIWHQADAAKRFATTTGRVLESQVETRRGSKGRTSYKARIRYEYEIDGRRYQSSRLSYFDVSSSRTHATRLVKSHPIGAETPVHYDPLDPSRAVLLNTFTAEHLAPGLILLGVNVAVVLGVGPLLLSRSCSDPIGTRVVDDGFQARLRPRRAAPLVVSAFATGIAAIVAGIGLTVADDGSLAPGVVGAGLGAAVVVGSAAYWIQRGRVQSGRGDLLFDRDLRTLALPERFGPAAAAIPCKDVEAVHVRSFVAGKAKGKPIVHHAVELRIRPSGSTSPEPIDVMLKGFSTGASEAEAIAAWMREQLAR